MLQRHVHSSTQDWQSCSPEAVDQAANTAKIAISIFDLDRTLTRRGTWSPFLLLAAAKTAPWRLIFVPLIMLTMIGHKAGLLSRTSLKQFMQRCMMGCAIDRAISDRLAATFADRLIRDGCYAEGIAQIRREQWEGRRVIIASAANRFYLDAIASRLGITEIVGTQSCWRNDTLIPHITGSNCYGQAKRDMLLAHLRRDGLEISDVAIRFFSDDASDLPLFEIATQPITVNASRKLRKIATNRGWPSLSWR